jgi:hypothetical protein
MNCKPATATFHSKPYCRALHKNHDYCAVRCILVRLFVGTKKSKQELCVCVSALPLKLIFQDQALCPQATETK